MAFSLINFILPTYLYFLENHVPDTPCTSRSQWYHGTLNRDEAVKILEEYCKQNNLKDKATDGVFLVRYSERHTGAYVLTMLSENTPYNFIIRKEVSLFQILKFIN